MVNMSTEITAMTDDSRIAALREKYIVRILLLVTALTYVGTIRFDFVYDDFPQIVNNPFLRAWRYAPQYFISSVWKQMAPGAVGNYYRPIFLMFLRMNYALFADRPLGWHLFAIGLHLLVTWLTYLVVRKITGQFTTAWLAALIFGVHPIHHEVVASRIPRHDRIPVCGFFAVDVFGVSAIPGGFEGRMDVAVLWAICTGSSQQRDRDCSACPGVCAQLDWIFPGGKRGPPGVCRPVPQRYHSFGLVFSRRAPLFDRAVQNFVRARSFFGVRVSSGVALDASIDSTFLRQALVSSVWILRILRSVLPDEIECCACNPPCDDSRCPWSGRLDFAKIA